MTEIVFLDTETTGLDPRIHHVWEIGVIVRDEVGDREYCWQVRPDLTHADPRALQVGGYWERYSGPVVDPVGTAYITAHPDPEMADEVITAAEVAGDLAEHLAGAVVVGSNPAFDRRFLEPWLTAHGQVWSAHYRSYDPVDIAWGRLLGGGRAVEGVPPRVSRIADLMGVDLDRYPRHTALGDCRWVRDLWDLVLTGNAPHAPAEVTR